MKCVSWSELDSWFQHREEIDRGLVLSRIGLRGILPLFLSKTNNTALYNTLLGLNLALVRSVFTHDLEVEKKRREWPVDRDILEHARSSISDLRFYDAALSRRNAKASSFDEKFEDGVLRRHANQTQEKYRLARSRAELSAARTTSALVVQSYSDSSSIVTAVNVLVESMSGEGRQRFWQSVSTDCHYLENFGDKKNLYGTPLWATQKNDIQVKISAGPVSGFWKYWYVGFVDGAPLNWELLRKICLSFEGDERVEFLDGRIEAFELAMLEKSAGFPEEIFIDPDQSLFDFRQSAPDSKQLYDNLVRKIDRDVAGFKGVPLSNAYSALEVPLEILERMLRDYSDQPISVHDDCARALKLILKNVENDSLPEDDDKIDLLVGDLQNAIIDLRTIDEDVNRAVESRLKQKRRAATSEELYSLNLAVEFGASRSVPRLARQLQSDMSVAAAFNKDGSHDEHPEPEQVVQRLSSRLPKIIGKAGLAVVNSADSISKLDNGSDVVIRASSFGYRWLHYLVSMV
jgi:hypothetical protein